MTEYDPELDTEPLGEPQGLTPLEFVKAAVRRLGDAHELRAKKPRGPEGPPEQEVYGETEDTGGQVIELRPGFVPEPVEGDKTRFRVGWTTTIAEHPELKRIFIVGGVFATALALGGMAIHQRRKKIH